MSDDFDFEPVPGLPQPLPEGETILWQGSPHWQTVAWRVLHLREITAYFGLLMIWQVVSTWWDTNLPAKAVVAGLSLLPPASLAVAILGTIAWLTGRMTLYTITDKRLVMRIGIAIPTIFNLPFARITAANAHLLGGGRGDISVQLGPEDRIAYLLLWPHARPWKLLRPEPMMRCVPDAVHVAGVLSRALLAVTGPSAVATPLQEPGESQVRGAGSAPTTVTQLTASRDIHRHRGLTVASQ